LGKVVKKAEEPPKIVVMLFSKKPKKQGVRKFWGVTWERGGKNPYSPPGVGKGAVWG